MASKELTQQELLVKEHNKRLGKIINQIKSNCANLGIRQVRMELDFIRNNSNTPKPKYVSHE